jgi:hypothetical protein
MPSFFEALGQPSNYGLLGGAQGLFLQARGAEVLADAERYTRTLCNLSAGFTAPPDSEAAHRLHEFQDGLRALSQWISALRVIWPHMDGPSRLQ